MKTEEHSIFNIQRPALPAGRGARAPFGLGDWASIVECFRRLHALLILFAGIFLSGCHTVAPLPPADLAAPGWQTRTGQAVWTPGRNASEITGELLVATRTNDEAFVQFTKNPFPFIIARSTTDTWQLEIPPAERFYSGRGVPSSRLIWLQFARWVQHEPLAANIRVTKTDTFHWRLENTSNGERLEGVFNP